MKNWRRVMAAKIARLTPEEARARLEMIRADGITIFHPAIRKLTGGFNSQTINSIVARRLAGRAGMIRKENA